MKKILFMFLLVCSVVAITSCQKEPEIVYVQQPNNPGNNPSDSENKPTDSENKPSYSSPFIGNWGGSYLPMGYENVSFSFLNDNEVSIWIKLTDGTDYSFKALYSYLGNKAWIDTEVFDSCDFIVSGSKINVYSGNEFGFTLYKY